MQYSRPLVEADTLPESVGYVSAREEIPFHFASHILFVDMKLMKNNFPRGKIHQGEKPSVSYESQVQSPCYVKVLANVLVDGFYFRKDLMKRVVFSEKLM